MYGDRARYPIVDFGGWKRREVLGQIEWKRRKILALSDAEWYCELKG